MIQNTIKLQEIKSQSSKLVFSTISFQEIQVKMFDSFEMKNNNISKTQVSDQGKN